jgi:TetR/AcrR family transcriptional regulator, regulator of cefoperazone and chloramphenicol sensitivity
MASAAAARRDDAATKARVLRAATELFAERGFHGTTMRDIAARAGANVASGHYHFGSKRDLYVEVLRATFAEIRAVLSRGGVRPEQATLDRASPAELERLLERRIAVTLENLLGPQLHGALMQREMLDPSEALPLVVDEFIRPMMDEVAAIVRRLAPGLDDETVTRSVASIMGQTIFYRFTLPATLRVLGLTRFTPSYTHELAVHIAAFSAGGIERVAARRRRPRAH